MGISELFKKILLNRALNYLDKDPDKNIPKLLARKLSSRPITIITANTISPSGS